MQVGLIRESRRRLLPHTTVNAGTSLEVDVRLSCVILRGAQGVSKQAGRSTNS
jgi:hypothetical protein